MSKYEGDYAEFVEAMKKRTKSLALRVLKLADAMPRRYSSRVIVSQIVRSGTSVGANYRAACRARTDKEFVNKMRVVLEEADETQYWIELIVEYGMLKSKLVEPLLKEAGELVAIFTKSYDTARRRISKKTPPPQPPKQ